MTGWRIAAAVLLAVLVLPPLFIPFLSLVSLRNGFLPADELPRLALLAANTLALSAGTVLLAVPAGTVLAVLLYRTDLAGRRALRGLVLLAAFVPLPLLVAGWESLPGGAPLAGRAGGLASAVLVHALAGLPWVVVLVGHGLGRVERELEEEGLTAAGPVRVLWSITLPRARSALALAAVWVGLQAATEITV